MIGCDGSDFPDSEDLRAKVPARFLIERKDAGNGSEIQRQSAFLTLIRKVAPTVMVFAIPNSAQSTGSKLKQKREGAIYGATDLVCVWAGGVAFIEFKAGKTMPRANQVAFMNALVDLGHHVAVARNAVFATEWLRETAGAPVRVAR